MRSTRMRSRNARTAGFLGIEKKFYDTSLVAATLTDTGAMTGMEHNPTATVCLNSVVQGDGESNRDGRKMVMKYLSVHGTIFVSSYTNQTVAVGNVSVMIAIVLDQQTNGALLNSENVFANPSGSACTVSVPFRNLQYIQRFKVLKMLRFDMHNPQNVYDGTNIEASSAQRNFHINIPLNDISVNFSGTTETIANIVDNSISVIANASNATTQVVNLTYNSRLRFVG